MTVHELAKSVKINKKAQLISKHSIKINSSLENVWNILTDIENWIHWNKDIMSAKLSGDFFEDQTFIWKSGGSTINSKIAKIDKPNILAWSGNVFWIKAIHIWKLSDIENAIQVDVSESMEGFLSSIIVGQKKLDTILINWLKALKVRCEDRSSK